MAALNQLVEQGKVRYIGASSTCSSPTYDDALAALELQLTPEEIAALEAPYQPHEVRGHGRTM